jgi:hypothetical protein
VPAPIGDGHIVAVLDEDAVRLLLSMTTGSCLGDVEVVALEDHLGTECAHPLDLQRVRLLRGVDRDGDVASATRVRDGLPEVAGRRAHDVLTRRQSAHVVVRPTSLERADRVEGLDLQYEVPTQ